MAVTTADDPPRNGNGGVVGAVARVSQSLIGALPPAFLGLVVVNCIFIGLILWFLDDQLDQRTKLVNTLVNRCMDIALHAPPPGSTIEPPPGH